MLTGPRRDYRFERTLHSVPGKVISSIILPIVEQQLRVIDSKVREIPEIDTIKRH